MYIKKFKYINGIVIPATCRYKHFGEKTGFNIRAMLAQY